MVLQSTDFRCERTRRLPLRTDTAKTVCSAKAGHKKQAPNPLPEAKLWKVQRLFSRNKQQFKTLSLHPRDLRLPFNYLYPVGSSSWHKLQTLKSHRRGARGHHVTGRGASQVSSLRRWWYDQKFLQETCPQHTQLLRLVNKLGKWNILHYGLLSPT